jgi:hypothetical protein
MEYFFITVVQILGYFFDVKKYVYINFDQKGLGYILGDFSQTRLVTLVPVFLHSSFGFLESSAKQSKGHSNEPSLRR